MNHALQWTSASPAWKRHTPRGAGSILAPSILRFDRDDFMAALQAHLSPPPRRDGRANEPGDLAEFDLKWESGGQRPPGAPVDWQPATPEGSAPKLFHPAHGRFYLVAASLVCRRPGLPDHRVDAARGERAACVLRRVRAGQEEAWIPSPAPVPPDSSPPRPNEGTWQPVLADPALPDPLARVMPGEELRPMFPVMFRREGLPRRLWAALIPVASRETYRAAPTLEGPPPANLEDDALLAEPRARVRQGLASLHALSQLIVPADDAQDLAMAHVHAEQLRLFLLDLGELLTNHLPHVYTTPSTLPSFPAALAELLHQTWDHRAGADDPLARLESADADALRTLEGTDPAALDRDILTELRKPGVQLPTAPDVVLPRFEDPDDHESRYLVRCVHRPHACKPAHPDLVSAPTSAFALASFFDADAPARPVRISLPVDTSVLGLRKSPRNVAFILSRNLRQQLSKLGKAKDLLDGKLERGGEFQLGEICSLSVPIITICAFLVLFIFLSVLNILFWWLPFAKVCLPIPRRSPS